MEEERYTTYCPKCGAEMSSDKRYCMKCGFLNSNHEANQSIKQYIKNDLKQYDLGSGRFVFDEAGDVHSTVATNTGNKLLCYILNFLLFLVLIIGGFLYSTNGNYQIKAITNSSFPIIAVFVSLWFMYFFALQLIYMKCNKPWWSALIPIYNMMVLTDIIFQKKWLGLLTLIPVVGQILLIIIIYKLAKGFNMNGVVAVLFSFICVPIMGFNVYGYKGYMFQEDKSKFNLEKEYGFRKIILSFIVFFFLSGAIIIGITNFSFIKESFGKIRNTTYVSTSKKLVNEVKEKVESDDFICDKTEFNSNYGDYYFYFEDVGKIVYVPFYLTRDNIEGYVKVEVRDGVTKYYVSIADETKGIAEVQLDDITIDKVEDNYVLKAIPKGANKCEFIK